MGVALVVAKECTLDAKTSTEWQLTYDGRQYDSSTGCTTFTYTITTISQRGDSRCTAKNCQDLSHWVLLTDCDGAVGSPDGSYGKDGQYTIDGVSVVGYKWEVDGGSVGQSLTYTLTVWGDVPASPVEYLVKGGTRCGYAETYGPASCEANPEEPQPECVTAADCNDNIACTQNACVAGVCQYTPQNSECVVEGSCVVYECQPDAVGADSEGCVQVALDDSVYAEPETCTDNVCDPLNSSDLSGCYTTIYDERCADGNVCSDDTCVPGSNDADAITGCVYEANNALCDDGDECTGLNVLDQCADFECVPGDAVCPYFTGTIYASQWFPTGNIVMTNNETHALIRWDAADSGWTTKYIHIYVGTDEPAQFSPGSFPVKIDLKSSPVTSFMVAAPLPDACSLDTVYFAVHVETTVDRAYCVTGVDGKQHCTTVGESATGWMKGNSTWDDKAWASYTSFSPCCCAGFSHVTTFLAEDSTVELLYAPVVKASAAVPEEQLATVISELLNIPTSAFRVISYEVQSDSSLEDAVVRFYDYNGVSSGTYANAFAALDASAFEAYGMQVTSLAVVPNVDNDVQVGGDLYSSLESESSSASVMIASALLAALALLL